MLIGQSTIVWDIRIARFFFQIYRNLKTHVQEVNVLKERKTLKLY